MVKNIEFKHITLILLAILVGLILIFAGCTVKQATENVTTEPVEEEQPAEEEIDEPLVQELPEEMLEEEPVIEVETEYKTIEEKLEERDVTPIGSRIREEEPVVEEVEFIETTEEMIYLLPDKVMTKSSVAINKGTTLIWENKDTNYVHILLIEKDLVRIATSPRLEPEDVYSYTFEEEGDFLIRDMFSGTMRMVVSVN